MTYSVTEARIVIADRRIGPGSLWIARGERTLYPKGPAKVELRRGGETVLRLDRETWEIIRDLVEEVFRAVEVPGAHGG